MGEKSLREQYPEIRFIKKDLIFNDQQYAELAQDMFGCQRHVPTTDKERAFIQATLLVAVDKSEKTGMLFSVWKSFMTAAPKQSIEALIKSLATSALRQKFSKYIDSTPNYSPVGKAGVQYSQFGTEWRTHLGMVRSGLAEESLLENFLA